MPRSVPPFLGRGIANRLTGNGSLGLATRVVGQPCDGRRQTAVAVWA
jgi:hypothetical protein